MGGAYCALCLTSEENEQRIAELENLLQEQENDKRGLMRKLDDERRRRDDLARQKNEYNSDDGAMSDRIEKLQNEKKAVFKQMLKEKKNVNELEDSIVDYKQQISSLEKQINELQKTVQKASGSSHNNSNNAGMRSSSLSSSHTDTPPFSTAPTPLSPSNVISPSVNSVGTPSSARVVNYRQRYSEIGAGTGGHFSSRMQGVLMSEPDESGTSEGSDDEEDEDTDGDEMITTSTTRILDEKFDAETEATHIYSWIHGPIASKSGKIVKGKKQVGQLKQRLASALTARSEGFRQEVRTAYFEQYGKKLEKDIQRVLEKGHTLHIIQGLLLRSSQYDAVLISEAVENWDIYSVADIICCRDRAQIKQLYEDYKSRQKLDIKQQLQALATKDNKHTLVKVIGTIFDMNRVEQDVDNAQINEDLNFALGTKNFKGATKERLVIMFAANSEQYIRVLSDQFKTKSKDDLLVFIDKKIGRKSYAGHFCKTRIAYAIDPPDYYARTIKKLGVTFNKNLNRISDIFIQRFEIDLYYIDAAWTKHDYGGGKNLSDWIKWKTGGSKAGLFLIKMLENCARYKDWRISNEEPGTSKLGKFAKLTGI
eukprot:CAMPEP_0202702632 /NCGR_PEP_ID=MMETSP1385-20130828/15586_1 /ASSEMBLY_ACC=CAM_ASM_000861 /TAXON_ID=933848 /ORGANISM="Elphidium margaritaceum" /LENGTH=594 /DNA_ID=CAMNT_0049360317 /DNA_START=43 /DNA_END=1827 /DNA_ORIENTATION=-